MRFFEVPVELLHRAVRSSDPELSLFAVVSALSHDAEIDDTTVNRLAGQPALRHKLWQLLEQIDKLDPFPAAFGSQQALAEAEMVRWISHPMEWGEPPQEIEFIRVDEHPAGEQYYFFRFRDSGYQNGDWIVGMAGPYNAAVPATLYGRSTFSRFDDDSDLDMAISNLLKRVEGPRS